MIDTVIKDVSLPCTTNMDSRTIPIKLLDIFTPKILTKGNNKPHFCHNPNCFAIDNPFTYVDTTIGNNFSRKVDKSSVSIDRDGSKKVWVFEMSNVCLIRPIDLFASILRKVKQCHAMVPRYSTDAYSTEWREQKKVKRLPPTHCQIIIELEPLKLSTG